MIHATILADQKTTGQGLPRPPNIRLVCYMFGRVKGQWTLFPDENSAHWSKYLLLLVKITRLATNTVY